MKEYDELIMGEKHIFSLMRLKMGSSDSLIMKFIKFSVCLVLERKKIVSIFDILFSVSEDSVSCKKKYFFAYCT